MDGGPEVATARAHEDGDHRRVFRQLIDRGDIHMAVGVAVEVPRGDRARADADLDVSRLAERAIADPGQDGDGVMVPILDDEVDEAIARDVARRDETGREREIEASRLCERANSVTQENEEKRRVRRRHVEVPVSVQVLDRHRVDESFQGRLARGREAPIPTPVQHGDDRRAGVAAHLDEIQIPVTVQIYGLDDARQGRHADHFLADGQLDRQSFAFIGDAVLVTVLAGSGEHVVGIVNLIAVAVGSKRQRRGHQQRDGGPRQASRPGEACHSSSVRHPGFVIRHSVPRHNPLANGPKRQARGTSGIPRTIRTSTHPVIYRIHRFRSVRPAADPS